MAIGDGVSIKAVLEQPCKECGEEVTRDLGRIVLVEGLGPGDFDELMMELDNSE